MSQETEDSGKEFDPSQKKLDDARKKGEIAKSNDLITAASYFGIFLAMVTLGQSGIESLASSMSALLGSSTEASQVLFNGSAQPIIAGVLLEVVYDMIPWFAFPAVLALICILGQRALVFAPSKVQPKLNRISLISGFKNKFGRQGIFEFLKSMSKLVLYSSILGIFLVAQMDQIIGSIQLSPGMIAFEFGRMIVRLTFVVMIMAAILGLIDFLWQSAEHIRKNRMSRKEMMEELKQAEGDPVMNQKRREKGREIAANRMLSDVPDADVIIVNPTHFAVALKWDPGIGSAPVCVAKGVDEIAVRIRVLGNEHHVPIHSDPPTARALHASVDIGAEIAPEHYKAVAAAIRFAESIRQKAGAF